MLVNREGQTFPLRTFRTRHNRQWVDVTTDQIFKGKTVVVFVLPGAFSASGVSTRVAPKNQPSPGFRRYEIGRYGVDEVICISTSDAFAISEQRKVREAFGAPRPPASHFEPSVDMGVLAPASDLGFGDLARHYSVLVRDGVIEKVFAASGTPGDTFEVSDADLMLTYLSTSVVKRPDLAILSRNGHPPGVNPKAVLRDTGVRFQEQAL